MLHTRFSIPKFSHTTRVALLIAAVTFSLPRAHAQTEAVIYSFGSNITDAQRPYGALAQDKAGNLYGTTPQGGAHNSGTVFELSPVTGGWQETVLHSFTGGHDGAVPYASVVFGPNGNLYGTSEFGGNLTVGGGSGLGVVFELSPAVGGGWNETVLHVFSGGKDGAVPQGLAFDPKGNLFGLARQGGTSVYCNQGTGCGTVFELTPKTGGGWSFGVIHIFTGGLDGGTPGLGMGPAVDANGNLYATTTFGGNPKYCVSSNQLTVGCGVAFKLSQTTSGGWKETVLYRFFGFADGFSPSSVLVPDAAGNIHGTAASGGSQAGLCRENFGCGVVFELTPTSSGLWNQTPIHTFSWFPDGEDPIGGLVADGAGNLYGPTRGGGDTNCDCGTVFKMAHGASGWTFSTLHTFLGGSDGNFPGSVLLNSSGNIFGATLVGGASSSGTVYEITP